VPRDNAHRKAKHMNDVTCNLDIIKTRRLSHVVSSLPLCLLLPISCHPSHHTYIYTHGIGSGYLVPLSSVVLV